MSRLAKPVCLSASEHTLLTTIVKKGTHNSRTITRARALLLMGADKSRLQVQAEAGIAATQYFRPKQRYLSEGVA